MNAQDLLKETKCRHGGCDDQNCACHERGTILANEVNRLVGERTDIDLAIEALAKEIESDPDFYSTRPRLVASKIREIIEPIEDDDDDYCDECAGRVNQHDDGCPKKVPT